MKIIRSTTGSKTCDWCRRLAGTYDYADVRKTGHDVWKRNAYCDCRIEYVSSSERYDVDKTINYVLSRALTEEIEGKPTLMDYPSRVAFWNGET